MLVIALVVVGGLSCAPGRPRDVVLITVDTLRADRIGAYGCEDCSTPTIDRLAADGVRFASALTPLPRTTPAVASLLTGLEPHHHGSREVGRSMRPLPTIASVLAEHGWATIGLSANPSASVSQGIAAGFDRFVRPVELGPRLAEQVTDRALELVAGIDADQPLFLWLLYVDPHQPYAPPSPWGERVDAKQCRALFASIQAGQYSEGEMFFDRGGISSSVVAECRALYDAEIAAADHQIGRLLDGLARAGRLDRALIVFTADHGENLGEQGVYYEHGPNLHEASLRVPLVITGPGIRPGVDLEIARLQDLAPTILEAVGIPTAARPPMDGVSLGPRLDEPVARPADDGPVAFAEGASPLFAGQTAGLFSGRRDGRHCFHEGDLALCGRPLQPFEVFDTESDPRLERAVAAPPADVLLRLETARRVWPPEEARERCARTARYKLVRRPAWDGTYTSALYDLLADPLERTDLSLERPAVAARLTGELEAWMAGLPSSRTATPRTEAEIEILRSLGYLE